MDNDEKEFVKKINIDIAKKRTNLCFLLALISLISYVPPLILGDFDFGIVFEIVTLVCIFIARNYMNNYDVDGSNRYIIIAMIPIGWLLIYDLITIFAMTTDAVDFTVFGADFFIQEGVTILNLFMLYDINKKLKKADNPEKNKESTDWFYERLNKKEN